MLIKRLNRIKTTTASQISCGSNTTNRYSNHCCQRGFQSLNANLGLPTHTTRNQNRSNQHLRKPPQKAPDATQTKKPSLTIARPAARLKQLPGRLGGDAGQKAKDGFPGRSLNESGVIPCRIACTALIVLNQTGFNPDHPNPQLAANPRSAAPKRSGVNDHRPSKIETIIRKALRIEAERA